MLIDWFTLVAQGLNFLVLVWLLKRYLYGPVLAAIDAREKHIALSIADAESQKKIAQQERQALEEKKSALDGEGAALLNQATIAAAAERARLLAAARSEADSLREKQMAALREDQTRLRADIAHRTQQEVLSIARKVLQALCGTSLEERVVAVFLTALRGLDAPAKQTLLTAFAAGSDALVHSAFDLPAAQRALIQQAVDGEFSISSTLRFEVSAELLCGLELSVGGQKLAWSVDDYLKALEQRVAALDEANGASSLGEANGASSPVAISAAALTAMAS
jgi:F-type H+-transporting ATPase subunit b